MRGAPILVQKFGGTSVSTPERRQLVVGHVRRAREQGYDVALVVSAMGRRGDPYATDTLLDLLRVDACPLRPSDYTLMFVTGEIISAALMSHTLNRAGIPAVGMTGAQARVFTDGHPTEAEILEIDVSRLRHHLDRGEVPVVTGGQGIERESFDYNTLGRGASDTSGVSVGVSLGAERVEIFTDVDGVASADPRVVPGAGTIGRISFERAHELARFGAKVIHPRAVRVGWKSQTPIVVRSTFSSAPGTWIGAEHDEAPFSGIAALNGMETVTVPGASVDSETLAAWERRRLIMSVVDPDTGRLALGCCDQGELERALEEAGVTDRQRAGSCAWISVIGESQFVVERARENERVLAATDATLRLRGTEPFRNTFVVSSTATAEGVRALHRAYSQSVRSVDPPDVAI